ncbi:MAG: hypothetical protein Ct9H90mP13_12350 [Pseudomonadota bacterium]|nr:MAG: hypothetical protein Ct9H90mP13_12350 [Pseudomonadota bacterium]
MNDKNNLIKKAYLALSVGKFTIEQMIVMMGPLILLIEHLQAQ